MASAPELFFVNRNLKIMSAMRRAFEHVYTARFNVCDISQVCPAHLPMAYVVAGNSFGVMSSGTEYALEHALSDRLPPDTTVQKLVQMAIVRDHGGELHVGSCVVVHIPNATVVYAPTVRVPGDVTATTLNAYVAFRAALLATRGTFRSLLVCCGMCGGGKDPDVAAKQMRAAYDSVYGGDARPDWRSIHDNHRWLAAG